MNARTLAWWLLLVFVGMVAFGGDYDTALQQASSGGKPVVVLVTGPNCPYCNPQRTALTNAGIPFVELDISDARLNQRVTLVPTTFVSRRVGLNDWRRQKFVGFQQATTIAAAVQTMSVIPLESGFASQVSPKCDCENGVCPVPVVAPMIPIPGIKPPKPNVPELPFKVKEGEDNPIVTVKGESWCLMPKDTWIVLRPLTVQSWYNPQTKQWFVGGKWIDIP